MPYFVVTIQCNVGGQFKSIPVTVGPCKETEAFEKAVETTSTSFLAAPTKLEDGSYQDGVFNYECLYIEEISYEEYRLVSIYC